ncbi:MAG: tetratricopeptide repeat protein [Verrucomicrobia bacterium]|nr:tetratricopeptide repeat protein [Verrucomicrobiota bacterium]MCH8526459.1 tetratricopeptide repeat protein [Kiritimatiellia bacterium]
MEPNRKPIPASLALVLTATLIGFFTAGCATRRYTDPLSPEERINLGVAYEQRGDLQLALREYQRAEQGGLRATALTYQGNVHAALGNPREAEKAYRAALKHDPEQLTALNNLAWLLASEFGKVEEALLLIHQALAFNPEPPNAFKQTLENIRLMLDGKNSPSPAQSQ